MAPPSVGIGMDAFIISQSVFAACSVKKGCTVEKRCIECMIRSKYLSMTLFQPFDFKLVHPTLLYRDLSYSTGSRPVSTHHIIAVFYAGLDFANILFMIGKNGNPVNMASKEESWHRMVRYQRISGAEKWEEGKQAFLDTLEAFMSIEETFDGQDLKLVNILEDRLFQALAIIEVVTEKVYQPWRERYEEIKYQHETLRLLEWTQNMQVNRSDRTHVALEEIKELNRQHAIVRNIIITDLKSHKLDRLKTNLQARSLKNNVLKQVREIAPLEERAPAPPPPPPPSPAPVTVPEEREEQVVRWNTYQPGPVGSVIERIEFIAYVDDDPYAVEANIQKEIERQIKLFPNKYVDVEEVHWGEMENGSFIVTADLWVWDESLILSACMLPLLAPPPQLEDAEEEEDFNSCYGSSEEEEGSNAQGSEGSGEKGRGRNSAVVHPISTDSEDELVRA